MVWEELHGVVWKQVRAHSKMGKTPWYDMKEATFPPVVH
jgi:hypothetical protein